MLKKLLNPSLLSVASSMSLQGFSLLVFMLLARLLSVEQMGEWALWLTLAAIADAARTGMVQNGFIRFSAKEPEAWSNWLTASTVLNLLASLGAGIVLTGVAWSVGYFFDFPSLMNLAWWGLPFVLIQGAVRMAETAQIARRNFLAILISNVSNGSFQVVLFALLFFKNEVPSLIQLIEYQVVGFVVGLFVHFFFGKKDLRFGGFEQQKFVVLARFGGYVAGTNFFSLLFQRLDTLLIGVFLSPAALAIYNVATRLNGLLDLPLNGLSLAQFPLIAKANAEGEAIRPVFNRSVRHMALVQMPLSIFMVVIAPWAVVWLAGEAYESAALLLQILAVAGLAKPWGRAFGMTLDAIGRADVNFKMLLFSMLVNLVLNLSLLPLFGVTGAAIATGLGIVVTIGIGQYLLFRIVGSSSSLNRDIIQAGA